MSKKDELYSAKGINGASFRTVKQLIILHPLILAFSFSYP